MSMSPDDGPVLATERRAHALLESALAVATGKEKRAAHRLGRLIADDDGSELLLELTDQVLRIRDPRRAARRLRDLVTASLPASLSLFDTWGLRTLGAFAPLLPHPAERAVDWRVDRETAGVILPGEDRPLGRYLTRRRADGFRLNVNVLSQLHYSDHLRLSAKHLCRQGRSQLSVRMILIDVAKTTLVLPHGLEPPTCRLLA